MQWEKLREEEYIIIWEKVYDNLGFNPNMKHRSIDISSKKRAFRLPKPFAVYDMSILLNEVLTQSYNYYDKVRKILDDVILSCMGTDNYVYVLDWQHECFKYYPMGEQEEEDIVRAHPSYFPDGEYYFYIAKDFSWGYLTHPLQEGLYVFGEKMVEALEGVYEDIDLKHIISEKIK